MSLLKKLKMAVDEQKFGAEVVGHSPHMAELFRKCRASYDEKLDFYKRVNLLMKDVKLCNAPLKKNSSSQFWRRILVRNLFALIEGQVYGMKTLSFHRFQLREVDFSPADLVMLQEHKFKLEENGVAHVSGNNFQKFIANYRFAFRCFAKAHSAAFELDTSKISKLKTLEQVRNRLVHPKCLDGLNVSDDDTKLLMEVWDWHQDESCRLFAECKDDALPIRSIKTTISNQKPVTQRYLLNWYDGTVYGFPSRQSALGFAKANSDGYPHYLTYTLFNTEDLRD